MTISWVGGAASGALHDLLALRPELRDRHDAMVARIWDGGIDPVLVEVCRVRVAQILGDADEAARRSPEAVAAAGAALDAKLAALAGWPGDEQFTRAERAALAVAEQFVIDVHGVTDEQMAALVDAVGPAGAVLVATALGIFEAQTKLRLALRGAGAS